MARNKAKNKEFIENQWPEGKSGNPNGRPKGRKNFATLYREAIEKIASSTGMEPDAFELEIVEQALRKARNGDIAFYRDTMDRLHGKAAQPLSNSEGENGIQPLLVKIIGEDGKSNADTNRV